MIAEDHAGGERGDAGGGELGTRGQHGADGVGEACAGELEKGEVEGDQRAAARERAQGDLERGQHGFRAEVLNFQTRNYRELTSIRFGVSFR